MSIDSNHKQHHRLPECYNTTLPKEYVDILKRELGVERESGAESNTERKKPLPT